MKANRQYIEAIATGLTGMTGVSVVEGQGYHTDIEKKIITYDMQDLLTCDVSLIKGFMLHETAHVKHTGGVTQSVTKLQQKYPTAMQELYNAFEDIRIDDLNIQNYGEFARQAQTGLTAYTGQHMVEQVDIPAMPDLQKILMGLLYREAVNVTRGQMQYRAYDKLTDAMKSSVADDYYKTLPFIKTVKQCKDINAVKTMVDTEVFPILEKYIKESEKDNKKSESKQNKGKGKEQSLQGKKQGKPQGDKPQPLGAHSVPSLGMGQADIQVAPSPHFMSRSEVDALLNPHVRVLARNLKETLKNTQATQVSGSMRSGHLLSGNAYRVLTGETKIFSRKITPNKPNYTVTLVLDESGSMREDNRFDYTYLGAVLIEQACKQLGFKTNTILFDDQVRVVRSVEGYRKFRGQNTNHELAMQEVVKTVRPSDDNLIFVITDGLSRHNPIAEVNKLRRSGAVVTAIGINLPSEPARELMRKYYRDVIEVQNVEELPSMMVRQLKKVIRK